MKKKAHKSWGKLLRAVLVSLLCLLLFGAFLAFYSAKWYADTYGQLGFDSILYTLLSDLSGVESNLVSQYVQDAVVPAICWSIPLCLLLFLSWRKKLVLLILPKFRLQLFPVKPIIAVLVSLGLSAGLLYKGAETSQLLEYLEYLSQETAIFQQEYKDPGSVKITFPAEKRNLIYIFLESMETTFFSKEQGGLLETGAIPELYDLAADNVNFSSNEEVGGLLCASGSTWTVGSMVTQTAAIPLKTPPSIAGNDYGEDGIFLPGATTLMDILRANSYYQSLMVGSDANFGGRSAYFASHGVDRIYDLYTARADGLIPPDYFEWWGFEDYYLFRYAKQELTRMATGDQPFALYMLTADTHHIGGCPCPYCEDTYAQKYENVLACSSRQVLEFVEWLRGQDFWESTTVVIVGDHPSMDNEYIRSLGGQSYTRRVYNCILNSATLPVQAQNRVACTIDMFPTTLAAMGCAIEGDRLGLGTNLFSAKPTLSEELGADTFDNELSKRSSYYTNKFFFGKTNYHI